MTAGVCSANYVVKNGKLYMKLYTENDVEEVEAYPEPYCFVPSAYDVESKFPIRVENTSLKTLDTNENVKKYSFMFPAHVKNFRDNIERFGRRVYEGDIPYTKRWMIDNSIKCPSYENVKAYWDIEVLDTNGFPDQETASEPIIAISVKRDGIETFQGDEKDILSNFLSYLKEEHVRLLIGWNSDWDKEYFVKRCRKNGVNVDEHSIRFLDIMQFYRYTVNRSRYSLSYVAKEFNETKPYEGRRMKDLKEEEIRERNVWDTLMTEKVDMKFHFSKLAIHLAQMSNLFPDLVLGKREDKNTVTPSPVHTNIILKRARALGYVCPSYVERTHEKYKGAYIHMPKSGIYENILQYDFSCLRGDTLVITRHGLTQISSLREGEEVLTPYGWQHVKKIHIYNINSLLRKIELESGKTIDATLQHKFPVIIGNKIKERMAEELRKGEKLIVFQGNPPVYNENKMAKLFGIFFAEGSFLRKDIPYFDKTRNCKRVSHQYRISFSISSDEKELRDFIVSTLTSEYPSIHIYEKRKKNSKGVDLVFSKKNIVLDFIRRLEDFLKNPSLEEKLSFLSGFFEGDGTVNIKRKTIEFIQSTVNEEKLKIISQFLNDVGISFNSHKYSYKNKCNRTYSNWYCELKGLYSLLKFYTEIGFISSVKNEKLRNIIRERILGSKRMGKHPKFGLCMHVICKGNRNRNPYVSIEKIKNIETYKYNGPVYDITLEWEEFPYYFANGILTHNSLYPNILIGFELAPWDRKEVFIPIVKEYLEQKEKAKDEIEYMAYKLLVNSMYGFFSSPYSRVYSSEVGEKVAEKGREIILFTIKFIESIGFKVIYGDTDSIFIQAPFEKKDIIQNLINEAIRQQFNVSNIRMKFEGYWSKILFPLSSAGTSVKKRYAGIIAVGKNGEKNMMEIVGLEHERGDWCFIDGTEILTINGWKNFRDVTEEDFVATLGKDGFLEYQKPIKIIRKDYDGEIIKIENKSIEIGVTPEHRMLVKENESKEYKFIEARNLVKSYYRFLRTAKWQGKKKDYFDVVGYKIKTEDWVRFMALWLAEGWADKRKVRIGQKNKIQLVREILNKLPFKYTEKTDKKGVTTFTIYSSALAKMLSKYGHAKDKFVDQNIKELESNMIRCFLDTFVEFDGYISHGSKEYCTSSKRLADDLQEMLLKCGSLGTIRECTEKGYKGKRLIYRIRERKFHEGYVEKKDIKRINYRGKVFCVTVPNGIIFVRYKGKPIWCGNCDLAKKVQEDVIRMLLEGKTRKEIEEYARKVIDDMKRGKYDDMLVLSKSVSKGLEEYKVNAQHVKALRDAIEKGLVTEDFKKYGVIHYVICRKGVPKIVDFVKKGEIDYTYYEKNQIMPILKRLGIFVSEDKTEKIEKFFT